MTRRDPRESSTDRLVFSHAERRETIVLVLDSSVRSHGRSRYVRLLLRSPLEREEKERKSQTLFLTSHTFAFFADLGTEHLRFLGDFRFTLGYIQGALSRKTYPIKLTVLVESSSKQVIAQNYNARLAAAAADNGGGAAPTTATVEDQDEMPRLRYGTPDEPLPTEVERDMAERRTLDHLPKDGEMDGEGKWWTIDLTSPRRPTPPSSSSSSRRRGDDKKGVFFLYGGKLPWISKDVSEKAFSHARVLEHSGKGSESLTSFSPFSS